MKLLFSVLAVFGISFVSYSQIYLDEEASYNDLPTIVIKNAEKDFSVYMPDKNPDVKVRQMQDKFIGYNLGKNLEGYDEFLVVMESENSSLVATYNENGKLMTVVENYTNVKLPKQVIFSMYKNYPGWKIIKDKFLYTQENGDVKKKQYNLKIEKGNEVKKIVIQPNGNIIAGL